MEEYTIGAVHVFTGKRLTGKIECHSIEGAKTVMKLLASYGWMVNRLVTI